MVAEIFYPPLGFGNAATKNVGTTSGTVAAGDAVVASQEAAVALAAADATAKAAAAQAAAITAAAADATAKTVGKANTSDLLGVAQDTLTALAGKSDALGNLAAFQATAIPAAIAAVNIDGYYVAGDGGSARYRRISTPSSPQPWQVQSNGGAWWELVPDARGIDIRQFGAKALTSLITPIDTTNAATNTAAIINAIAAAKAFGYIPIRICGRFVHDGELHFVGDHKVLGEGPTPHAYAVAQLTLTGPSALLYSGSGTQITFENVAALSTPTTRGWRFEGIELITLYGSARAFHGTGVSYGNALIYAIGHDVAAEFDTPSYPGGALNGQSGGEDEYSAHNNVHIIAQSTKTILKLTGSTDPAKGNVCKNTFWVSGSYGASDGIVLGNSDSNDFREVYLYKNATTYSRTINTTAGSNVVTVSDASSLAVGMTVFSDDIPSGSTIQAINGTSLTLTRATGNANARKTKTGRYAGFSTATGRGIVSQGGSAYPSSARSNLFSGELEVGEGGIHILGTEDYSVASQNTEIKAWNFENNSFNGAQVVNIGAGASLTLASTQGTRRWSDVSLVPTGRKTAEWRVDGVKALGFEGSGAITTPLRPISSASLSASLTLTSDGTRATVVAQNMSLNPVGAYNATTGVFTCSVSGTYRVRFAGLIDQATTDNAHIQGVVNKNSTATAQQDAYYSHTVGRYGTFRLEKLIACAAADTLNVQVWADAAATIVGFGGGTPSLLEFELVG